MAAALQTTSRATPARAGRSRWVGLAVVLSATFMALFDFFVVNVAAPSLQHDLHASSASVELVVGGYAFAYASGMVTGGRLGDLFGYRRLFVLGMLAFSAASALCGIAATPGQLVVARLLQGIAGAAMVPQVLALISTMFPGPERARALAWFGVTAGIGAVAGQVLGGIMLDADLFGLSWRPIFLVNVPVGLLAVTLAMRVLPGGAGTRGSRLDPVGAVGISAALGLLLVPLVLGRSEGWPVWTWISIAAALPVLVATLRYERSLENRGGAPTLDLDLFARRSFVAGLLANAGFMAFFGSFMLCLTIVLQGGLGLDPRAAGLTFAPMGVVFGLTSVLARPYIERYGRRAVAVGAAVSGVGMGLLALELLVRPDAGVTAFAGPLVLIGLGNGTVLPALIGAVLAGVPGERAGSAAGILTTTQQFASALGVAVLGSIFFSRLGAHPTRADFAADMAITAALDVGLIVVTIVAARFLPRPPQRTRQVAPVEATPVEVTAAEPRPCPSARPSTEAV